MSIFLPSLRSRVVFRSMAVLGVGLLLFAATACGDDDSSTSTPPATGSATTAPSSDASLTPGATPSAAASAATTPASVTLTVYSGQHEALTKALGEAFEKATGNKLEIRSGSDADLANQIIEEGSRSKADIFMTEEPGPIGQVDKAGLLAHVDDATATGVDKRFVPSTGNWIPYAARSRVIYYNPNLISEDQLPASLMDLAKPEWKGKFAYAPSGAFAGTVSYLIDSIGADATLEWLKGIKANGINEGSNGKVRDTVEAGQHAFGLSNHYYWWILANQQGGPDKLTSKVYYFDHADAGSLVFASGAGIVKSSSHQAEAQAFLKWLTSAEGGQAVVASFSSAQYPVATGVTSKVGLQPLADLKSPDFDQGVLAATKEAKDLIIQSGIS